MTDMETLKGDITEIKSTVRDIYKVLNGNGSVGLVTQAHLNKQAIKRAWWLLSAVSMGILGIAVYILRCGLVGGV